MTTDVSKLPYSAWREDGNGTVYVSGQVGLKDGKIVGGFEAQVTQALANLCLVLVKAGVTTLDVIKVNVYLANMADFAAFNTIYEAFFHAPYPARTAVVASPPLPGLLFEIDAIAYRGVADVM